MRVFKTKLKDCVIIEPELFKDERGFFFESFQEEKYAKIANISDKFVQDNHSKSFKNVLRGLHYQLKKPQGKLVRVTKGEVFDVAVDIRKDSPTFGQWESIILSDSNSLQFWVPPGFAHGFLVLSDTAEFQYKCTEYYDPEDERSVLWSDKHIGISWPCEKPILSIKDKKANLLSDL